MRIAIVEDEPVHSRYLTTLLREMTELKIESIRTQKTLTAAECFLMDNAVDLLFLDLNLYGETGFNLLKNAAAGAFSTIVVSAHSDRAVEAFEYGVLDFIPKPVTKDRLQAAIERYKKSLYETRNGMKYFSVFSDSSVETIQLDSILYFQASGKKLIAHLTDGSNRLSTRKIGDMEKTLPEKFLRVHKSYIIDRHSVKKLNTFPGGKYEVILSNGDSLPVSRKLYSDLKGRLLSGQ